MIKPYWTPLLPTHRIDPSTFACQFVSLQLYRWNLLDVARTSLNIKKLLARARILRFLQVFPYHWRMLKDLKKCLSKKSRKERNAWHFVSSIFLQMGHKQIADMHRSDPFSLEQCEVLLNGVQIMTPLLIKGNVETCWHFCKLLPAVLESVSYFITSQRQIDWAWF